MKTITYTFILSLLIAMLITPAAMAAEKIFCPSGQKWDGKKGVCVEPLINRIFGHIESYKTPDGMGPRSDVTRADLESIHLG